LSNVAPIFEKQNVSLLIFNSTPICVPSFQCEDDDRRANPATVPRRAGGRFFRERK
jgi:hypothetical protein